jgi:hypothetical protein
MCVQEILHVHVPHYTHMFQSIMAGPRPWRFGHIYLPEGSRNLGSPEYALEPRTRAPLTGTLAEILHCDQMTDGRMLLLIGGVGRIRVGTQKPLRVVVLRRAMTGSLPVIILLLLRFTVLEDHTSYKTNIKPPLFLSFLWLFPSIAFLFGSLLPTHALWTGTLAKILHCDQMTDGRMLLLIGGVGRIRVGSYWVPSPLIFSCFFKGFFYVRVFLCELSLAPERP